METESLHDKILSELGAKHANNKPINLYEVVALVDLDGDCYRVKKWMIDAKICNKGEWDRAVERQVVINYLGAYPESVSEYLDLWIKKNKIEINYKGAITYQQDIQYAGMSVKDELNNINIQIESEKDPVKLNKLNADKFLYENIIACKTMHIHIDDICRKMRLKAKEFKLRFGAPDIDDAMIEWVKTERPKRKMEIYEQIMFNNSASIKRSGKKEWKRLIEACFDTREMSTELVTAIFQKFIFQVKCKMINRPVMNHLMPVILGPQGVGKSTFMEKMTEPMKELQASTDFAQITDDRNIDLWENYVLVMDEMGYASKADIDSVKHHVTAPVLIRRMMRTNNVISVHQNATFIGASNKEMAQLIRDETGIRRFAGVRYKNNPDWKKLNEVDFKVLWQSIDERGDDPIIPHIEELRKSQEGCRSMRPAEEWLNALGAIYKNSEFESESVWFGRYKVWERDHYEKYRMDVSEWRLELERLSKQTDEVFPMQIIKKKDSTYYKFLGKEGDKSEKEEIIPEKVEARGDFDPEQIKKNLKKLNEEPKKKPKRNLVARYKRKETDTNTEKSDSRKARIKELAEKMSKKSKENG